MKATGVVREIDKLGRFVIPKEIRNTMEIETLDSLEIFTEGDRIILKKYAPSCVFCGEQDEMTSFQGKLMCKNCIRQIASLASTLD